MAKLVSINPLDISTNNANKPFSPRIINWVEPVEVKGYIKTVIYTEVDSNLKAGERVFIINGNYDSDLLIKSDKYRKGRDGYKVIEVDKCKITLDLDFTGVLPWNDEILDNFIRVYPVRDNSEFRYVNRMITTEYQPLATPQYGGTLDSKFNIYQNNVIFTNSNYAGFSGFGENTGLSGSPGFFIKGGTGSWTNVTSDFTTNFSTFLSTYTSNETNQKIKIMNASFTYGGKEFKEGFVYKYENNEWVVDVTYFRPFISKANFRDGNFKGTWNSGLFGRQDKKIKWEGIQSTWNIGTILNTLWDKGSINSIFTSNQSYFSGIDEFGLPYQKINPSNNRGFGYNYIVDSEINTTIISNGNFYGTLLGTQSATFSSVESYIRSWTSPLNVSILGGEFNNCTFESADVKTSEIKNSRLNNSKIIRSKSINSHFTDSLFYGSKFNSDNIIKVLDYDEWIVNIDPSNPFAQYTIYKFYISEENYNRLKHKDQFYINGILVSDNAILNLFDKKFILNDYQYHDDVVTPGPGATKNVYEYTVNLNTTKENEYMISGTSSTSLNTKKMPSVDVIINTVGLANGIINTTNAYIIDSDFRSGLFETSDWNSGSYINHNYDNVIPNLNATIGGIYDISITSIGSNKLTISMPSPVSIDDDLIKVGSIVYLNSIDQVDVLSNITTLPDTYKVSNILPPRVLILEEVSTGTSSVIAGLTFSSSFSTNLNGNPINNRYNYLHLAKINNSNIKSGMFRRTYISNSVVYNQGYNNRDFNFNSIPSIKSLLMAEMIFRKKGNVINSGMIAQSFITEGNDLWNDGIFYNSSWLGQTFSNGVLRESRWENGVFTNGIFYKSNAGGGVSYFSPSYQYDKIQSFWRSGDVSNGSLLNDRYSWIDGIFLNGEFYKSGWENGIFKNGKFYLSDWFDGTFSNGVLGDVGISTTDTNFYNGTFDNGTVENASVFAKNTDFAPYSTTPPRLVTWNNGIFKSGVFGSVMYNQYDLEELSSAIWNNGTFNGGEFTSNARWKNGTFNGGKFTSGYGWTMSTSTYSTDYSWENGIFNEGEFGVGSKYFSVDKDFYTKGNSTWYTGEFNGGKFQGRVWNNGVFTSGNFEGSATYSAISPLGTTCASPNNFTNTFNQSGLVMPHYFEFVPYAGYGPGNDPVWYNGVLFEYIEPFLLSAGPAPSLPYWSPATMSVYQKKYHGLWRNGTVTDVKDKFIKDRKIYTDIKRRFTEKKVVREANIKNVLWNTGTFSHTSGQMVNSVWLDGRFTSGKFKSSSFNPYVKRNGSSQSTFNLNDNTCYWENGTLDSSDFYISKWNDGKFLLGTGVGMIWQNGVANYMNAFNVFWEDGTWRNGNWYGSGFTLAGSGQITDDYLKQILFRGMSWSGTSSCHVWNIFLEEATNSPIILNVTASGVEGLLMTIPSPPPVDQEFSPL